MSVLAALTKPLSRFTLAAASMAGVEFETEDFARTAAEVHVC